MNRYYKNLRNIREDRDLTQAEIAAVLNTSFQYYSTYESGKRELPLSRAIILADFYGVTLDYLVGREKRK